MNHKLAMKVHAAEAYILGELTEVEKDAYEEHMFDCPVCAAEVQRASQFHEDARKIFVMDSRLGADYEPASFWQSLREKFLQPVPAFACAIALLATGFGGYQTVANHQLQHATMAQVIVSNPTILEESRAAITTVLVSRDQSFSLRYFLPEKKAESYDIQILTRTGIKKLSVTTPAPERDYIELLLQPGVLAPGEYVMVVRGRSNSTTGKDAEGEGTPLPFKLSWKN
jgi:hypothetical protein